MRTQSHLSLLDVPEDLPDCDDGCDGFRPGCGLCCPEDPLDLVLQFFPNPDPAPHEVSLAALGIGGGGGSPRGRQDQPPSLGWAQENSFGGGVPVLDAGSAPGGGGSVVWEPDSCGLSSCVPVLPEDMELIDVVDKYLVKDEPDGDGGGEVVTVCNPFRDTTTMPGGGVRACGSAVPNDRAPPMSAGALHPHAFRAFPGVVPNGAPQLPLPAPKPEPGGLHACGVVRGDAPAPPMLAGALHASGALVPVSNAAPPPSRAHAPPPARTLPASSHTSSGCTTPATSETSSLAPVWQPLAWAVRRKRRRPSVKYCKRPWSLDFPLHAVPPGYNNGNDDDAKNSCYNAGAGGGIRRRRPVPRQRNRQTQRVCSHCHSPDTPQWRAGPDGPGTLCNACGIRYAANKLLPEYRPSTAPSFRSDLHSNRHRKVVKLREQKAKETPKVMPDLVPLSPKNDEFMGVCTYISTG
ncbi:unnamed protein product [Urochloa decumbens]|uniref:GATA-type domain-containing protein n=1 Tax=Urochloa decumbens TaxID=240449 RepID=A0ABC9AV91_9POAL